MRDANLAVQRTKSGVCSWQAALILSTAPEIDVRRVMCTVTSFVMGRGLNKLQTLQTATHVSAAIARPKIIRTDGFMGRSARKIACLASCALILCCSTVAAQQIVESELILGPAFTSVDKTLRVGIGAGAGMSVRVASIAGGSVLARVSVMPVFAIDSVDGLIISHAQIPLTVALSFQEPRSDGHPFGLGGSIGLGMIAIPSRITSPNVPFLPCVTFDLTFGVFERGALTMRYTTAFGGYQIADGRMVSFQSFVFIGSTQW